MWTALLAHWVLLVNYMLYIGIGSLLPSTYIFIGGIFGLIYTSTTILLSRLNIEISILWFFSLGSFLIVLFIMALGSGGPWSTYSICYPMILWWAFNYSNPMGYLFSGLLSIFLLLFSLVDSIYGISVIELNQSKQNLLTIFIVCEVLCFYAVFFFFAKLNEMRIQMELDKSQNLLIKSERLASMGALTAGIAHEINNPINFISNNAKALELDLKDLDQYFNNTSNNENVTFIREEMKQLIDSIISGSDRITSIIRSLSHFNYRGVEKKQKEGIEISIESSIVMLKGDWKGKIDIHRSYEHKREILIFPDQIHQVILNILKNAIHSISEKGNIKISTTENENHLIIEIQDDGIGMTKKIQQRMFEPFYTTKEIGEGTGLGMSISHSIINAHNGDIQVDSHPGQGTKVTISLPFSEKLDSK